MEASGICKISDFGISKRTDDEAGGAFTAMQGTVFWMAPEVINTQKKGYNFKIDIWSVGCVVLEMWAGKRPWIGQEMVAVMFKVRCGCLSVLSGVAHVCFSLISSSTKISCHRSQRRCICHLLPTISGRNVLLCEFSLPSSYFVFILLFQRPRRASICCGTSTA